MTPTSRRPASAPDELRRELRLVRRLLLGALVGTLAAVPFLGLLLLVRAGYGPLSALDGAVADGLNGWARQRPGAVDLLELLSDVTSPWTFRVLVVVVAVALWRYGRRRLATWAVVTMAVGGALGGLLKFLVGWARPEFKEPVATAAGVLGAAAAGVGAEPRRVSGRFGDGSGQAVGVEELGVVRQDGAFGAEVDGRAVDPADGLELDLGAGGVGRQAPQRVRKHELGPLDAVATRRSRSDADRPGGLLVVVCDAAGGLGDLCTADSGDASAVCACCAAPSEVLGVCRPACTRPASRRRRDEPMSLSAGGGRRTATGSGTRA